MTLLPVQAAGSLRRNVPGSPPRRCASPSCALLLNTPPQCTTAVAGRTSHPTAVVVIPRSELPRLNPPRVLPLPDNGSCTRTFGPHLLTTQFAYQGTAWNDLVWVSGSEERVADSFATFHVNNSLRGIAECTPPSPRYNQFDSR